jgi:hypothetical protein
MTIRRHFSAIAPQVIRRSKPIDQRRIVGRQLGDVGGDALAWAL